ncbi:DUF4401 domain-containing protein [Psychrobacter vallis]|uniref:DUF4401 domain-containing protein n=1 Tax=Psychrobacter vallis TaxID=248451 RepID=UPI00191A941C|nr:DUF4401 domain-containing protein [Psychrobacter vallis]
MNDNKQALIKLKNLGLIDTNVDHTDGIGTKADSSIKGDDPWFLHVFFGISGILASLLFIGFLTLLLWDTSVFDSALSIFVIGLLLSIAGFGLFKNQHMRRSSFWISLAFAISAAGQLYAMFALLSADIERPLNIWLFLLFQMFMTLIMPNFVYRLLSSAAALGGLIYLLSSYQLSEASLGLVALITIVANLQRYTLLQHVPPKWRAYSFELIKAVGYASALMLLCISVYFIAAEYGHSFESNGDAVYHYYVAQALLTLASLYAAYLILKRYQIKFLSATGVIVGCTVAVLGIVSIYVSGLLATCLLVVIAMANSQRTLLAIGMFALVSYVFWYYYQLDTSLLVKSISMLVVGIALLLMRWLLIKRYFAESITHPATDSQEHLS